MVSINKKLRVGEILAAATVLRGGGVTSRDASVGLFSTSYPLTHTHAHIAVAHRNTPLFFVTVSTFVPKKGIASPSTKGVSGLKNSGGSMRSSMRNDIKMMPIGVPKVAYRVPGGQGAEW